jgi:hypothetical protein
MSKSYEKDCIFCGNKIQMSDEKGKWRPFNADGTEHDCKKNGKEKEITLEAVRKKLESIGISLDLAKLMNQK